MSIEPPTKQFKSKSGAKVAPEDLFLPSLEGMVRHLARMAAERDYKNFLMRQQLSYNSDSTEGGRDA